MKRRDAQERFRRQLEKVEREAGFVKPFVAEPEVRKGCDVAQSIERGLETLIGKGQGHPQQYPSGTSVTEAATPEVEWVAGRSSQAKRQARARSRPYSH